MAKNLRAKIAESDTMVVNDVNAEACSKLQKEVGNIEIVKSVREVAEKTVCEITIPPSCIFQDEPILFYL